MNYPIKIIITVCLLFFITTSVIPTQAAQVYKGNDTQGGFVPDFTQQSIANNSGICAGAAFANSLWYFDQHNYSNLVSQTDESKPNDNWVNDSKKLTLELAYLIYGKEYVDKKSNKINKTPISELMKGYLKIKSPSNFTVKYFNGSDASYTKWESELNRSEDVIAVVSWRYANGTKVFNGTHAITGAGYDTDGGKLKVSNGWGDNHWNELKPYNESFFNEYNITNTSSNQMKIPKSNNTGADVFEGVNFSKADHLLVDGFWAISPRDNKTSKVVDKRIKTENPKIDEYQYTVFNHGEEAMYQFVLEIPVSFYNVQTPSGWSWKPWDPTLTPDITPRPPVLQPPGEEPMEVLWEPDMKGVIWYTGTNPIMPVKSELNGFDGFSYQVDNHWGHGETSSFSGLSNGISGYLGSTSSGLTTEFDLVSGPCSPPKVESSDSSGEKKDTFKEYHEVHAYGSGYAPEETYDLYIVKDRTWTNNMPIPPYMVKTTVSADADGDISPDPTLIWPSAVQGKYDIIVDVDENGMYDECIDALDDMDVNDAGFEVPALTTIGLIALIGLLLVVTMSRIRRQ